MLPGKKDPFIRFSFVSFFRGFPTLARNSTLAQVDEMIARVISYVDSLEIRAIEVLTIDEKKKRAIKRYIRNKGLGVSLRVFNFAKYIL